MRRVTLDEISESTKISKRSLQALEEERFELLPGGIFNKGFVRAYARYLGIDEEQAVADYLAASQALEPQPAEGQGLLEEKFPLDVPKEPAFTRRKSLLFPVTVAAGLLVIIFGGWKLWNRHQEQERQQVDSSVPGGSTSGGSQSAPTAPKPAQKNDPEQNAQPERTGQPGKNQPGNDQPVKGQAGTDSAQAAANLAISEASRPPTSGRQTASTLSPPPTGLAMSRSSTPLPSVVSSSTAGSSPSRDSSPTSSAPPDASPSRSSGSSSPGLSNPGSANASLESLTGSQRVAAPIARDGTVAILVKAKRESWIRIVADGKTIMEGTLDADQQRSAKGKEIQLRVGNAGGVDVSYNGKPMGSLGQENQVRDLIFPAPGSRANQPE